MPNTLPPETLPIVERIEQRLAQGNADDVAQTFYSAVQQYHRFNVTRAYGRALEQAKIALATAPCDGEALHWHRVVRDLEAKTTPFWAVWRAFSK